MADLILGIDAGTTAMKAAVFDACGTQLASAAVEYDLITPDAVTVEAPCEGYLNSIVRCMEILRERGVDTGRIDTVGFSVQGETMCFLDRQGEPLGNAIVWMDTRAQAQAEKLREAFSDETCYRVTGQVSFEACWPAAKVLWVRENEPERFSRTRHILLLEDYLLYRFTGRIVSEGSLLTSTEYWDIRAKKYWQDMLAFLGIDTSMLPEIREPGEVVGVVLESMAELLGIAKNAKICTGCLDQAAGAIGVGNIRPGIFSENIGAALAVCVPTETLTYDPNRQMPVHYFALPDTYMMHTFTTGGMCLRWFRDVFCQEELRQERETGRDAYQIMDEEASAAEPGSAGLLALPHLQGAMAPDVNIHAKGVFFGATLQHRKGHFIRSIMESIGYIICRNLEVIDAMALPVSEIRSLGGGSKSTVWNQMKADITGKTLVTTEASQDIACLGAAILAGVAVGAFRSIEAACASMVRVKRVYTPNPEHFAVYRACYAQYRRLFSDLDGMFRRTAP